jgi:micrococcal nuclease
MTAVLANFWQQPISQPTSTQIQADVPDREAAVVSRVIDGDTIELEDGRVVRYIGIDTPETKHPSKGVECFGQEAYFRNQQLVEGKVVLLEKDVSETDRYDRLLRYVWLDDQLVNQVLVEEGFATSASFPPDISRQQSFQQAEQTARQLNRGLWSACNVAAVETNDVTPQVLGTDDPACQIKGNISANGQLYHLPSCPSYDNVVISPDKGEKWFCSEQEAMAAGWSKASNC